MRIETRGVIRTGEAVLDTGITDLVVHVGQGGVHLFSSTGRNGGLAGYRIGPEGNVTVHTTVVFPPELTGIVSGRLILDTSGSAPRIYAGVDPNGLIVYGLQGDMALGGRVTMGWQQARTAAESGPGPFVLEALVTMTPRGVDLLPAGAAARQIVELRCVTIQSRDFVVIANADDHAVRSYLRDPRTGALMLTDIQGAGQGLGIHAPTGMELVVIGGVTFAVLVSARTSSVTILRIEADGRLMPTDHVIDTGSTRFAGAQAVAVAQSGDHTFVIVGGADHGVTLFLLLPDGRLVYLDAIADTAQLSLHNVSAITAAVVGGVLHIFVGSQAESGITHLTVPVGELGIQRSGTPGQATRIVGTQGHDILIAMSANDTLDGGAGMDILVSGPGRTLMRGGDGADRFIVQRNSTQVEIADFQRGLDGLDLTDLPMLRGLGQLTIVSTATGARITYRGTTIIVTSADGQPLTAQDLFPQGLIGPDRIPLMPRVDPVVPGIEIFGTAGNDTLFSAGGNDTVWGGAGNDRIELIRGNDVVYAGPGDDTIIGSRFDNLIIGGTGNDLIFGTGGNNQLGGGDGNDTIHGGPGNDTIWGAGGDDLIYTGPGRNEIWAGAGNDTVIAGDGGNNIGGGHGNDVLRGGMGNDSIWGWDGNDLIFGTGGRNQLWGGRGNDTIHAGDGGDILGGVTGNDLIIGGAGNDTIYAGQGNDTIGGGGGADLFFFYRSQDTNLIRDFNPAEGDVLMLARGLWRWANLTTAEVVALYGSINAQGATVLDFSASGGTVIVLAGFDDLEALIGAIEFI
jgi:Ca2+-binding RTX toxin-like protein